MSFDNHDDEIEQRLRNLSSRVDELDGWVRLLAISQVMSPAIQLIVAASRG